MIDNAANIAIKNAIASLGFGLSKSKSDISSTTYNNSIINALNGNLTINSNNDTDIVGANLLAKNTTINTSNNLNVESLQNTYNQKDKSFGVNLGFGTNNSGNFGVNYSTNKIERSWVDDQTAIIGTNSVNINTTNNTNLTGSLIANIDIDNLKLDQESKIYKITNNSSDKENLNINTGTLTIKNLYDKDYAKNQGSSFSTGIGFNSNSNNPNQDLNFYPLGSTRIALNNNSSQKEQTTYATIGQGAINITNIEDLESIDSLNNLNRNIQTAQVITKDQITGALNIDVAIDNRLIAAAYEGVNHLLADNNNKENVDLSAWNSILSDQKNLKNNLSKETKLQAKIIDAPLTTLANSTANIKTLGVATSLLAGEGGSFATLATQLLGLDHILDSGNSKFQKNIIKGLDNKTLAFTIDNKYKFKLDKDLGDGSYEDGRNNILRIFDNNNNEINSYKTSISFKDIDNMNLNDFTNNKDISLHGIYNTSDQALKAGLTQLYTINNQENNSLTFNTISAPSKGLILDGLEVFHNFLFGKTPLASANLNDAKEYGQTLGLVGQYENVTKIDSSHQNQNININQININQNNNQANDQFTITPIDISGTRFVGHSGGGDRLYMGVLAGAAGLDLGVDKNNKPVTAFTKLTTDESGNFIYQPQVAVQFYGTPSYTKWMGEKANKAGAYMSHTGSKAEGNLDYSIGHKINSGDLVGNILGGNSIFIGTQNSPIEAVNSMFSFPLLFNPNLSPHATYLCQGAFCKPDQLQQVIQEQIKQENLKTQ